MSENKSVLPEPVGAGVFGWSRGFWLEPKFLAGAGAGFTTRLQLRLLEPENQKRTGSGNAEIYDDVLLLVTNSINISKLLPCDEKLIAAKIVRYVVQKVKTSSGALDLHETM